MEARAGDVSTPESQRRSANRPHRHAREGRQRVAVLAQEVAQACAVPVAERDQPLRRVGLQLVGDREGRVVLDPRTPAHRTQHVVDLLARRPGSSCAEPERFVEAANLFDHLPAKEDGERDRPVPEVVRRQHRGINGPGLGGVACGGDLLAGEAAELGALRKAAGDSLEEVVGVGAVVVREGDHIAVDVAKPGVPGA